MFQIAIQLNRGLFITVFLLFPKRLGVVFYNKSIVTAVEYAKLVLIPGGQGFFLGSTPFFDLLLSANGIYLRGKRFAIKQVLNTILCRMPRTMLGYMSVITFLQIMRVSNVVRTIPALEDVDKPTHGKPFDALALLVCSGHSPRPASCLACHEQGLRSRPRRMAEREGFEPPVRLLGQRFSRPPQ